MVSSVKPVAGDDTFTFYENETISGNVLTNDVAGANGNKFLRFFDGESVLAKKPGQITDIQGEYGTFHVKADGSFTYTLSDAAKSGFLAGQTLTENLNYKISDGSGNTDVAHFSLNILGVTTKPTAVDDNFNFNENDAISGNVLANDIVGEGIGKLFLRSVEGTKIDAKLGPDKMTDVHGDYGTFHFKPDGSFTYDLDQAVKDGLDTGQTVTEELKYYKISDGEGVTDVGIVKLTIDGSSSGESDWPMSA